MISPFNETTDGDPGELRHVAGRDGILMIAYHFPPSAAVGGRRALNFGAALRDLGWDVHALTIPESAIEQIDAQRPGAHGIPVHIAGLWPTVVGALTAASKLRRGRRQPAVGKRPMTPRLPRSQKESIARRVRRYVMSFAMLPDAAKGWCVPATFAAVRLIRRHRLPWFMTSCPPYSVHLIGLAVKVLSGARWVADFRDPWMTTGSKRLFPTCAASLAIESWLERKVIEHADLVVFNVERLRDAYRTRYAHVPQEKFTFIPNAIPRRDPAAAALEKYDRFTICYTGSLYVGRSPAPVFEAASRLIQTQQIQKDALRIMLVGQCRDIDGMPTEAVIRQHGLESVVEVHDHVPYARAFDMVRRSHLALLLAPNLPYQIPAKLYDYLGAGTRILAIAEDGGTADLLRETAAGHAFRADEIDAIADFIHSEMTKPSTTQFASLGRFDATRITEDLVGHIRTRAHASTVTLSNNAVRA